MWLLDLFRQRTRERCVLHAGAQQLSCFVVQDSRWVLKQVVPLAAHPVAQWPELETALRQLKDAHGDTLSGVSRLLLDSHWAPACWVPAGQQPFSPQSFLALAKHRFSRIHGASAQAWHIRSPYLVGDAAALAFALPDGLQRNLAQGLGTAVTLEPTLSAIHDQWTQGAHALTHHCLLEDDRMLLLTWQGQKLLGCHPALDVPAEPDALSKVLLTERRRLGLAEPGQAPMTHVHSLQPRSGWPSTAQSMNIAGAATHWHVGMPTHGGAR